MTSALDQYAKGESAFRFRLAALVANMAPDLDAEARDVESALDSLWERARVVAAERNKEER